MAAIKVDRAARYPAPGAKQTWRAYVDGLIAEGLVGWGDTPEIALYELAVELEKRSR